MVILDYQEATPNAKDPRLVAGMNAERQMAHYLNRAFGEDKDVMLLHGLRIVDETREEPGGGPVVAQIDHLVLHRHGAFIVESKSCTGSVRISASGSGRDEWAIKPRGQRQYRGMPSPLAQASRQADVLRAYIARHDKEVLGKILGIKQRTFTKMPIQLVAAIADGGMIDPQRGWRPRQEPFADSVEKADNVCDFICAEVERHRGNDRAIMSDTKSEYGWWASRRSEVNHTARLLFSLHTPRRAAASHAPDPARPKRAEATPAPPAPTAPPPPRPSAIPRGREKSHPTQTHGAVCKACGETHALDAMYGKYGYYWKCRHCAVNTTMPRVCSACSCADKELVRIQKRGPEYTRRCGACSISEVIWRSV